MLKTTKEGILSRILIIVLILSSATLWAKPDPEIKVRIADSLKRVSVSGVDLKRILWTQNIEKQYLGFKKLAFNCVSKTRTRGYKKPVRLATLTSGSKLMNLGREKFKGKIHVQTSERFNGCDVINELSLEDYIATLLAKEMNSKWPLEALKAQAVAARSYAYHKIETKQVSRTKGFNTYYDLENSEKHQVNGSYFDATRSTHTTAKQTRGEVMLGKDGKLVPVFFHSKCGGKTRRPDQVWANRVPGYTSVACPFCHEHGKKNWTGKIPKQKMYASLKTILSKYNKKFNPKGKIRIIDDHLKSSQIKFYVDDSFQVVKKSKLRSSLGRDVLPSNYFLLTQTHNEFKMIGSGYGHGVGMCQFGAKELAKQGYSYIQILKHYFPELKIKRIY